MEELFRKLKTLQNIRSTNDKKRFIKANEDDLLFKTTLKFLLDPYVVTNISKKKIEKKVKVEGDEEIINMYDLYNYLTHDCTGRDTQIASVQAFINEHKEFEGELKEVICKNYKLGCAAKLVNQALGYTYVPDFNVQLASKFEEKNIKNKDFIVSTKVDGIKCICIVDNGKSSFFTRQGKKIEELNEIKRSIDSLGLKDFVFDGEIYYNGEVEDSKDGYKKTMNNVSVKGEKTNLKYIIYDCVTSTKEFYDGYCKTPTIERKNKVKELLKESDEFIEYLGELYVGNDKDMIFKLLKEADEKGDEGVIVSVADSPWEGKRSKGCMKLKSFKTADVLVTDIYEGDNKYKGKMGGVNASFIYKGEIRNVKIGSGWDDETREYLFKHPEDIINKVIEISYFEVTESKENGITDYSLRFPTVNLGYPNCLRLDKSSIDETNIDD